MCETYLKDKINHKLQPKPMDKAYTAEMGLGPSYFSLKDYSSIEPRKR